MRTKGIVSAICVAALALVLTGCAKTNTPAAGGSTNQANANAAVNTRTGGDGSRQGTGQTAGSAGAVAWMQAQGGWQKTGTVPACPNPANLPPPVDLTKVTSILYPGQTRGGNYKPHGGFRMDNATSNNVAVTIPMAGEVVEGSRYLVNGETQYLFDIMTPCGWMIRLGHLLTLTPKFQAIADTWPAPQENDSRTTSVRPAVAVTAGEQIASAVGVTVGGRNVFLDFGVFDYNQKNAASANADWAANHDPSLEQHGICWFDLLSAGDEATVRALPAGDAGSGKTSDYCK